MVTLDDIAVLEGRRVRLLVKTIVDSEEKVFVREEGVVTRAPIRDRRATYAFASRDKNAVETQIGYTNLYPAPIVGMADSGAEVLHIDASNHEVRIMVGHRGGGYYRLDDPEAFVADDALRNVGL